MKKIINRLSGIIFTLAMLTALVGMASADGGSKASFIMIFAGLAVAIVSSYFMEVTEDGCDDI